MRRRGVRIHELAQGQIDDAIDWWTTHREAAPRLLDDELARALAMIARFPEAGRLTPLGRRRVMGRTRYVIDYIIAPDGDVEVVRFVHMSRRDR